MDEKLEVYCQHCGGDTWQWPDDEWNCPTCTGWNPSENDVARQESIERGRDMMARERRHREQQLAAYDQARSGNGIPRTSVQDAPHPGKEEADTCT